ncbi:MAG: sigma-70 family RNA polymerase sigma factor [Bacteroidetes bacterium]|nr:MAG: sigma-70 family RNA polymerase sigma factor [Bacteroidota bacterium]
MDYHKATDEAIISAITEEGKAELFGILYDRYADKVFRKCISFVKDPDPARDLAQDILLKVFTQLSRFKGNSRFSTWLYAVTYNHCVEHYRRHSRFKKVDIDQGPDLAEENNELEQDLLALRADKLQKALDRIPPEDKMLLLLKYQDDTPIKELMEQLDISESAVKMRLARARQRVRQLIQEAEKMEP